MKEEPRKPGSERADTRQAVRLAGLWALGGLAPPGRCKGGQHRIVHWGDQTGAEIIRTLHNAVLTTFSPGLQDASFVNHFSNAFRIECRSTSVLCKIAVDLSNISCMKKVWLIKHEINTYLQ